jgi:hypothetical protein
VVLDGLNRVHGALTGADGKVLIDALKMHRKACKLGRLRRFWGLLAGVDRRLLDLDNVKRSTALIGWSYSGIQDIAIDQIVGSEGLSNVFDSGFYPLQGHDAGRWLETAIGHLEKAMMPVIEIAEVDSRYYAQTGQYHLSVARAQGRKVVSAFITRWEV